MANQTDVLYSAFTEYRKKTIDDSGCKKLRAGSAHASADSERVTSERSRCVIERDWVDRIGEGLVFVEKAIREERQFIRQEGNVVPVEKVKQVSKDSVSHLARHSNLITHVPEKAEDDVIPDKLFTIEKLSDYSVYENRFLYMMLCYTRDFIELRYSSISEVGNSYCGRYSAKKQINIGKRKISYSVNFKEESANDPYAFFDENSLEMFEKLKDERQLVSSLLMTPLMKEVSQAPLIKPPITRTNAMRMNNNFREALALYDYLVAYTGLGYEIQKIDKTISPLPEDIGDEFAEIIEMLSFLTYEHGNDLKGILTENYLAEQRRLHEEAIARQRIHLEELKKRLAKGGTTMEEYLGELEKYNKVLERDKEDISREREQLLEANHEYELKQTELNGNISDLRQKLDRQNEEFIAAQKQFDETTRTQREQYIHEVDLLNSQHEAELDAVKQNAADREAELNKTLGSRISESEGKLAELTDLHAKLDGEHTLTLAELHGLKQKCGMMDGKGDNDFSSKERFEQLESEYTALGKLLEAQWGAAKKDIRKRLIWKK